MVQASRIPATRVVMAESRSAVTFRLSCVQVAAVVALISMLLYVGKIRRQKTAEHDKFRRVEIFVHVEQMSRQKGRRNCTDSMCYLKSAIFRRLVGRMYSTKMTSHFTRINSSQRFNVNVVKNKSCELKLHSADSVLVI